MSAGKVDAIAAIGASLASCGCTPCPECDALAEAGTAVAELARAARALVLRASKNRAGLRTVYASDVAALRAALDGIGGTP